MGWQDGTPLDPTQKPAWMQGSLADQIPTSPTPGGAAPESIPQATILGDLAAGSRNWQTRTRRGLADTGELLGGPILKKALAFMNPSDEDVASAEQAVKQGGPLANATQMAGDIGANVLTMGLSKVGALPQALQSLKGAMPALGQAAYSAAVVPKEDKVSAATIGGVGTAAAPMISSLLTGPLRNFITPEARALKDAGINISPSVAITGEDQVGLPAFASSLVRTLRDKATFVPGMGDVITQRNNQMLRQGAVAKINEVLSPFQQSLDTNLPPRKAFEQAEDVINAQYDKAKEGLILNPNRPITAPFEIPFREPAMPQVVIQESDPKQFFRAILNHFDDDVHHVDERVNIELRNTFERLMAKPLDEAKDQGRIITGTTWKEVDSHLNKLADDALAQTTDAFKQAVGKGYKTLQEGWLHIATDKVPGSKVLIRQADEAYARLQPVAKASESVMNGVWTPRRMHSINTRAKIEASPLDRAMEVGLGDLAYKGTTAGGAASSGPAMAKMAGLAGIGEGVSMMGFHGPDPLTTLGVLGTGAAGAYGMGSKPSMAYLERGINPVLERGQKLAELLRLKSKGPYNEVAMNEFIRQATQQGIAAYGRE